jgi:hypothetical protein
LLKKSTATMNIHLTKKNQVSSPMKLLVLRQNVLIQTL